MQRIVSLDSYVSACQLDLGDWSNSKMRPYMKYARVLTTNSTSGLVYRLIFAYKRIIIE